MAGTTGGIPAVARLLRVVARLPTGAVVLPGLDTGMDEEAWEALETRIRRPGWRRSAARTSAPTRGDVRPWPVRCGTIAVPAWRGSRTLARAAAAAPAGAGGDWHDDRAGRRLDGLSRLRAGRPAGGSRRHRAGAARGAGNPGRARRAGDAGPRPRRPRGGRAAALRRRGRRQRGRAARRHAAGGVPAPAGPRRRRGTRAGAAAGAAEASAGRRRAVPAACRAGARALELACLRGPRPAARAGRAAPRAGSRAGAGPTSRHDLLRRLERCLEPALRIAACDRGRARRGAGRR